MIVAVVGGSVMVPVEKRVNKKVRNKVFSYVITVLLTSVVLLALYYLAAFIWFSLAGSSPSGTAQG